MLKKPLQPLCLFALNVFAAAHHAMADSVQNEALKMSNPLTNAYVTVVDMDWDHRMGIENKGHRAQMTVKPLVPFSLTEDYNLVARGVASFTTQNHVAPGLSRKTGFGDLPLQFYFTPSKHTGKFSWGAGPTLYLPTGTDQHLSTRRTGAGPASIFVYQSAPWLIGGLASHNWSIAGPKSRTRMNTSSFEPIVAYAMPSGWMGVLDLSGSYDWVSRTGQYPLTLMIDKVVKANGFSYNIGAGPRYWLRDTPGSPKGIGWRLNLVVMFPK